MFGCSQAMIEPIFSSPAAATTGAARPTTPRCDSRSWKPGRAISSRRCKDVTHRWSGQVLDTIDYAGFIGSNPGSTNIYVHTGDSGQGMTHGVVGAMINSALILGREARWVDVYDPRRKTPAGISNFLKENITAVKNFAEYLAPGELLMSAI